MLATSTSRLWPSISSGTAATCLGRPIAMILINQEAAAADSADPVNTTAVFEAYACSLVTLTAFAGRRSSNKCVGDNPRYLYLFRRVLGRVFFFRRSDVDDRTN